MRQLLIFGITILWLAIATACSAPSEPSETTSNSVQPTPTESSSAIPSALLETIKSYMTTEFSISPDDITVESAEAVEWSDACLGVPNSDELCAQVITPGYRILLNTPQGRYELHTNRSGQSIRVARSPV